MNKLFFIIFLLSIPQFSASARKKTKISKRNTKNLMGKIEKNSNPKKITILPSPAIIHIIERLNSCLSNVATAEINITRFISEPNNRILIKQSYDSLVTSYKQVYLAENAVNTMEDYDQTEKNELIKELKIINEQCKQEILCIQNLNRQNISAHNLSAAKNICQSLLSHKESIVNVHEAITLKDLFAPQDATKLIQTQQKNLSSDHLIQITHEQSQ